MYTPDVKSGQAGLRSYESMMNLKFRMGGVCSGVVGDPPTSRRGLVRDYVGNVLVDWVGGLW